MLQHGSFITPNIDKWKAITPELFTKISGISVKAPEEDKTSKSGVYMTPKFDGSAAVPELKLTTLTANTLVPKELNGWVALNPDEFATLVGNFMKK